MAWWDFERWQQEVDWMALNGINLPLAFTGQEYVWHKVWRHFGLAEADMDFTGPAFLAWNRMGNVRNWASPLPSDWRESQRDLARQILAMTRAYGMTNVLPCFGGHVPGALRTLFPSANITAAPIVRTPALQCRTHIRHQWNNFNGSYNSFLLDPTDPLFYKIGKRFIDELVSEFGTDHMCALPTFLTAQPAI